MFDCNPEESGWYWIWHTTQTDEQGEMAYFFENSKQWELMGNELPMRKPPKAWVGPVDSPVNPFLEWHKSLVK